MKVIGIFMFMTLFVSVFGNENQNKITISPSSTEVVHFVNSSHIVTCKGHNNTKVQWFNPKGNPVSDTKGRVHIEDHTAEQSGSLALVFEHITTADKGNWSCSLVDDGEKLSFQMIVMVNISFMDTPIIQSAREGRDDTIRCEVKGDPEPTVMWYFNGQSIYLPHPKFTKLADGLLIKSVSRNDTGEYTCKAFQVSAEITNVQEQTIRLNVQHKPIASVKASAIIEYGYLGGVTNLTCEAVAEPAANFIWFRHGKKISPRNFQIFNGTHISILQVLINDSTIFGDYKCKASNIIGITERLISLQEGTKPAPPNVFYLRGVNFDTLDIDVGAVRKPKDKRTEMDNIGFRFEIMPLTIYKGNRGNWSEARQIDVKFIDGVSYLLTHLKSNTTYIVRVASRNPAGLSDFTQPKEFLTLKHQLSNNVNKLYYGFTYVIMIILTQLILKLNNTDKLN